MSHFTKIDRANIISTSAFIAACNELKLTDIKTNVMIKDFYGQMTKVDVAAKVGKYDIALKKNDKGTYDMIADWWGVRGSHEAFRSLSDVDLQNQMLQLVTKHTIIEKYTKMGFRAKVTEDEDKNLQVELVRF